MKRTMSPKERVLTAISHAEPDRVPINYEANLGIDRRLKEHFRLQVYDTEGLLQALGVDFRGVWAPYTGSKLHNDIPERGIQVDDWGIHRRWIEHGTGGYWDYCDFPLQNATEQEVADWPMPAPDNFDYSQIPHQCHEKAKYALFVGHAGIGDIINSSGMLRGAEQILMDLITDNSAGLLLAKRRTEINLEILHRTIEAAKGGVDILWMGEDLGTQISPIISPELYRKHICPLHQQFIDLAKSYNLKVVCHTCGSSSWVYEDFIAMGIDVVDTLQPEAKDMSPAYLKRRFGGRLAFHGCISTAGPVAFGSTLDVVAYCRETLKIMMPGGGYCFAPTHQLQDNSPTENVVAMYEAAHKFGRY